jgi:protoporphyrinogen oxidase
MRQLKGPKARSVSFQLGMQEFISKLADSFPHELHLNQQSFQLHPNTILCADAHATAQLLKDTHAELARELEKINYIPLASVTALVDEKEEMKNTFGFLFPRHSDIRSLGVLFNQEIFPHRCGVTFILGDTQSPAETVQSDLTKLGWKANAFYPHTWTKALPVYNQNRFEAVSKLHQLIATHNGLVIFGNYVAGISLRDMIQVSQKFALDFQPKEKV